MTLHAARSQSSRNSEPDPRRVLNNDGSEMTIWEENKAAAADLVKFVREWRWRQSVQKACQAKYIVWWLVGVASVAFAITLAIFRESIVFQIQPKREAIHDFPFSWLLPLFLLVIITATPFTGRQLVLILIGIVYDWDIGLAVSATGIALGEALCFFVFKSLFAAKAAKMEQTSLFYAAVAESQRRSGVLFLTIVRYSFIPGRVASAMQSISGIPFWKYMAAVILSMPKQIAAVWIGALVVGEPDTSEENRHTTITIVLLVVTAVAGVIALYEVYMRARRYYPEVERRVARGEEHDPEMAIDSLAGDSDDLDAESSSGKVLLPEPPLPRRNREDMGVAQAPSVFHPTAR